MASACLLQTTQRFGLTGRMLATYRIEPSKCRGNAHAELGFTVDTNSVAARRQQLQFLTGVRVHLWLLVTSHHSAPHFDMLYAVAMNATAEIASLLSHTADAARFRKLATKAIEFINKDASPDGSGGGGGLWNGSSLSGHYIDVWSDKRQVSWVLEDQVEGVFHDAGVVPTDRIAMMLESFDASGSEGEYGVRETYPYIDPNVTMGQAPACYHNGGAYMLYTTYIRHRRLKREKWLGHHDSPAAWSFTESADLI